MFGCFNCTVLRSEKTKEEIRKEIENKAEELKQIASQIGMVASIQVSEK